MKEKQEHFKLVYDNESDNIFRFVLLRVSNREDALDLTGEVFLKFWHVLLQQGEIISPRALLFTIARNKVIDWYRKKRTESLDELTQEKDDESPYLQPIEESALHELTMSVEAKWALRAIERLPTHYREVVMMRFVSGLAPQEIAEVLGVTPNAVSLRLNQALQKMRKELGIEIKHDE